MKSREKASSFREGTHTHTGWELGEGLVGLYIYMLYTYVLSTYYYTYKVVSMQLVHVKVAHILSDSSQRGECVVSRADDSRGEAQEDNRPRAQGKNPSVKKREQKRGGGTLKGCH